MKWLALINLIFHFSALSSTLCVLDGGGYNGALCGRKDYLETVDQAFRPGSINNNNIYSGYGSRTIPDCDPVFHERGNCTATTIENCTPGQLIPSNQIKGRITIISEPFTQSIASSSSIETRSISEPDEFLSSCLPRNTSDQSENEDCHFWSANHGSQKGITTKHFYKTITPEQIGSMISNSICKSTKYVLNNCYSGQFHQIMFDQNNQIIPSRDSADIAMNCGVTATSSNRVAQASTIFLGEKTIETENGETIQTIMNAARYDFSELMSQQLSQGKNLEEAYKYAFMHDPRHEVPRSSSQYFLGLGESIDKLDEDIKDIQCTNRIIQSNLFSTPIEETIEQLRSVIASDELRIDIKKQNNTIVDFEKFICKSIYKNQCPQGSESEFIIEKYNNAFIDVAIRNQEEIVDLRQQLALLNSENIEINSKEHLTNSEIERSTEIGLQMGRIEEKLFRLGSSPDVDESIIIPLGSESKSTTIKTMFQRYRLLRNSLRKTILLGASNDQNKINQYLMIKRCEQAPFQEQ